ncbi:MAG: AEC family transporter [Phycisphaeraceae bacterium]
MSELAVIWVVVVAVFGVMGVGFAARRVNWLTEEADQSLLRLVIRVLLPAFIFTIVAGNERLREPGSVLLPPLVGFGTVVGGFVVGLAAAHLLRRPLRLTTPAARRTFALCIGLYNYGYLPIPLIEALFGKGTLGVLLVHNVGVEVAMWSAGIILVSGAMGGRWWRRLINPPLLALALALTLNFTGGSAHLPPFLMPLLDMLGRCAVPMGLLLAGATVADELGRAKLLRGLPVIAGGALLRLGLLPVAFLALAWALPSAVELKQVVAVQAAMPAAVFPIILARHYGGDPPTAIRVSLGTSLLALVTMPLWLSAGIKLLGL